MAGLVVFAAIGLTAAATRPTASVASLLPTLAATAAAAIVLRVLIERIGPAATAAPRAWGDTGEDDADAAADSGELIAPDLPPVPHLPPGMGRQGGVIRPSAGQGHDWLAGTPVPSGLVEPARRGFLAPTGAPAAPPPPAPPPRPPPPQTPPPPPPPNTPHTP